VDSAGNVCTWGSNDFGQLGDSARRAATNVPSAITSLQYVDAVAAGSDFCFAWGTNPLNNKQKVWAWGRNDQGQLCLGTISAMEWDPRPAQGLLDILDIAGGTIKDIQAGRAHAVALIAMPNGTTRVYVWGYNDTDQLASPLKDFSASPIWVNPGFGEVVSIGAGADHSLVKDLCGWIWTWGSNAWGQLGNGTAGDLVSAKVIPSFYPTSVPAAGEGHNLGLVLDPTTGNEYVWAWGQNDVGQLGTGLAGTPQPQPIQTFGPQAADQVVAGGNHSLALLKNVSGIMEVWAWGRNIEGQLGLGHNRMPVASPAQIPLGGIDVQALAAGGNFSAALDSMGNVYTWGNDSVGQLGDSLRACRT